MALATNPDEVFRACAPDTPLTANDERYVDLSEVRGTPMLAKNIARRISRYDDNQYHQQLISGHRGCGKSTELLRLQAELEAQNFLVVYIDVEELLDLANLEYLDILLSIAKQTTEVLADKGIELNSTLLEDLHDWFAEKIEQHDREVSNQGGVETEASVGGKIPFLSLLGKLTAEIKASSSHRETTRKNLERELRVFITRLNALLLDARDKARQAEHTDIVLIVDGLEKMHYAQIDEDTSTHTRLFVDHAEQLKAPECHIIYTMPISLVYSNNMGNDFDNALVIPMVKTNPQGHACLREVIAKRVDIETVFGDPALLDELVALSGGVMRDLIRLVRLSTDTDNEKIGRQEIDYAKKTLVLEFDRLVREEDFEHILWVTQNHRMLRGKPSFDRMLSLRLILEYQNGNTSADIHPALHGVRWIAEKLEQHETS